MRIVYVQTDIFNVEISGTAVAARFGGAQKIIVFIRYIARYDCDKSMNSVSQFPNCRSRWFGGTISPPAPSARGHPHPRAKWIAYRFQNVHSQIQPPLVHSDFGVRQPRP
ncbi:hypothetical protein EVAR_38772_1 [Eumeta japonica]|uniref:Uncharacterized protein n=1 Tax=Eumeta variegata TaxID=151549 RepID=A0A4C1WIY7_EUMVA|nr:hypothetical protein EVAR_38772_1 [Eumeta japonica]